MNFLRSTLVAFLCLIPLSLPGAESVLGKWITGGGKSVVEIAASPDGSLSGRIVSLKEPLYVDPKKGPVGTPKVDHHNPDPSLRSRFVLGLKILDGFTATGEGLWEKGTIYDPESGKTYQCRMKLTAKDRLEVRGFIGISLLGRTTVWTR